MFKRSFCFLVLSTINDYDLLIESVLDWPENHTKMFITGLKNYFV